MPENINDRIIYSVVDRVARIELARSEAHNSLDRAMGEALRIAAECVARDTAAGEARVAVVSARGRSFSVGGDLGEFSTAQDRGTSVKATANELHSGLAILRSLEVPVVSVINGTAAGGGLGIALVGDIVIAASEAKLVMAYTASGLSPDCGLTWVIPRRLSWVRAMDLVFTNRVLTGAEAAEWGLVSRAVPREELGAAVDAVVVALRDGASGALVQAKRLMTESSERAFEGQTKLEAEAISRLIGEPDGVEGVNAFLAKRKPEYR